MKPFAIRGFNLCETLLRHSPQQLRIFIRRMKILHLNTLIVHYDYGWKRYQKLIISECRQAGVDICLMTFGPRTFFAYSDWTPQWFAKDSAGRPRTLKLECETFPCAFEAEARAAFAYGAQRWLRELPQEIRHVHMRAADGFLFCQCPRCRDLSNSEKWQVFIDIFVRAVQEVRPELQFETDIYVQRYTIPQASGAFAAMNNIMYDTFFRSVRFPLGSCSDAPGRASMALLASEAMPDAPTPNSYHYQRLKEWTTRFPGQVYIHENAMGQGFLGTFQYGTLSYLEDLKLFREWGVLGVCYEAYEPGFANFAAMFEVLSRALLGEEVHYEPGKLERKLFQRPLNVFCDDADFPIEDYITDSFGRKQLQLYRQSLLNLTAELFGEYVEFARENAARSDPLLIGFVLARQGYLNGRLKFDHLSERAADFLQRSKLWDFMEELPLESDPRQEVAAIIDELVSKCRNN